VSQVNTIPPPKNVTEALQMLRAGMGFLTTVDATQMVADEQGRCLQTLECVRSMGTAAHAWILAAFIAAQGYHTDADYSPRAWLINRTGVTKGAATASICWAQRTGSHPRVLAALAATDVSESVARTVCDWTDKLPEDCRDAADAILVAAARSGAALPDLARLAGEIYARSRPPDPDDGPDDGYDDRSVWLETTFAGAGVLRGDLSPECAAMVTAVLDALSAPAGAGDLRTHQQRYHDALQDAMQRLLAAGLLPERAGQPVRGWVHMTLAELLAMDKGSALEEQWITEVQARWAGARAAASVAGSDGAAWLDGDAARAVACDALLTPVVTGEVDPGALDGLVRLCVELSRLDPGADGPDAGPPAGPSSPARESLERAIIGKAVELLSGPGGLASFLRREQLGARLGGPSLPLDIGYSDTVPASIRNAVILRDRHCQWAGGCSQPASACQVHHVRHKANGGRTSVKDCVLLCFFHHQVVIHRWGWTLVLNPDGTTTAWNPDRTKVLHSHGPPARAG
jgi:hypothetical protein